MNMGLQMFLRDSDFDSLGYISRSGIAKSHSSSVFHFLRKLHPVFHSGFYNLQSHWEWTRVPFSPRPHQHLSLVFLIAILTGRGDISTWFCFVFPCLDTFAYACWPFVCFWENVYFYLFCYWVVCVLDSNLLPGIWFANIFSHSAGCLLILPMVSFAVPKLCGLVPLINFCFCGLCSWCCIHKIVTKTNVREPTLLCLLLGVFQFPVLCLSMCNPFLVNFGDWSKIGVRVHSFAHRYPVFPPPFVEETLFSPLSM